MAERRQRRRGATPAASAGLFDEYAIDRLFVALTNVPDPDSALRSANISRERLRIIEGDDEILSAIETRRDAVIGTPWRLELPSTGEAVDWLWAELESRMDSLLRGAWSAVPYGYSVLESVYEKREDGRIGIAQLTEKPLEWFMPHPDGRLVYLGPSKGALGSLGDTLDTRFKFLLTRRNPTYRNPYGEALLSRLYWAWYFRHNAWRFWMQFVERFGNPIILGQVINPGQFVAAIQGLGMDAVIGVDRDDKVTAVTQGLSGEFGQIEAAITARMQRLILGQTLTSSVGDTGSFAAAKVHNEVRDDKRISDLRLITPTAQRLVDALWALNRFPGSPPTFVLADGRGLETERAERDSMLVGAGAIRLTEKYLLRAYDYEPGEVEVPEPVPRGTQTPEDPLDDVDLDASDDRLIEFAHGSPRRFTRSQMQVEQLGDAGIADAGQPIATALIRRAILAAANVDDLRERLGILMTDAAPGAFAAALNRALMAADVLGYIHAEEQSGARDVIAATLESTPNPNRERELAVREIEAVIHTRTLDVLGVVAP